MDEYECPCGGQTLTQEEIAAALDAAFPESLDELKRTLIERGGQP